MQNVKNTMLDQLLSSIAPHLCRSCGSIGSLLCDSCKYDITYESSLNCVVCQTSDARHGVCESCREFYNKAWCVGERSGVLQRLIGDFKFNNVQAGHKALGDLLLTRLDELPPSTVIVPIPTISAHIRQRGYDHTLLLAQYIAKSRNLRVKRILQRETTTVQRGADRAKRHLQAAKAFRVAGEIKDDIAYLILDDVVTTGATLTSASRVLKDAGAKTIWAAAIAHQPLD